MLTRYLAYLQNPKTHRKPAVSDSNRNLTRAILIGTVVLLFSIATGLGAVLSVYSMNQAEPKTKHLRSSYASRPSAPPQAAIPAQRGNSYATPAEASSSFGGGSPRVMRQPITRQTSQGNSFAVEMKELERSIELMEKRLGSGGE